MRPCTESRAFVLELWKQLILLLLERSKQPAVAHNLPSAVPFSLGQPNIVSLGQQELQQQIFREEPTLGNEAR